MHSTPYHCYETSLLYGSVQASESMAPIESLSAGSWYVDAFASFNKRSASRTIENLNPVVVRILHEREMNVYLLCWLAI